ncbi:RDD family protein [Nafulsella turpanensis]|uniref:RDD family protein n=1 Tax=Nafulsella turpanensis TaxID=1265690 RepID=UPI000346C235|nr:RDD family protein [Nafulsella turpanensis]
MQKVGIQTTQNVLIDYEVAGLGERIGAYLLDALLLGAYLLVLVYINIEIQTLPIYVNVVLVLPVFLYHLICEVFFNGQSLAKKQLHIKVVRLDGTSPGLGSYLLRWILRPVDFLLYGSVAILCILIGGKGQRLGDIAAGTTVVKYRKDTFTRMQPVYAPVQDEDHVVTFPQVNRLTDEDIALIRETLQLYRRTANGQPVQLMSDKAKELLGVETNMPPVKFLNVLLKDYQHLSTQA